MKNGKKILNIGLVLLTTGLLTACSSGNDIEEISEQSEQRLPEQTDPKNNQNQPENNVPEDSMMVDMLPQTRAIQLTPEQLVFAQKNNNFTFNLYRAINDAQEEKKSNITSPLSVTYVMGMLNDGAAGTTAEEITKVLGYGDGDKTAVNTFCQALIQQAPLVDPNVMVQIANIVASDKSIELKEAYKKNMQNYYEAEVASLDFSAPESLDYINYWCNQKTLGMIPKIIDELNPEFRLILMNAICFKATWTEMFDEKETKDDSFTMSDGSMVTLPMMHRNALIQYCANETFSSIRLPFGSGDKYSMYILLPTDGKTVDDITNLLSNDYWEQNRPNAHAVVNLELPRFTTISDTNLNGPISQLGATSMFDASKADFTGISNNQKDLFVSLMKQKATIEVSEEGTKTSAVTVAIMDGDGGPDISQPMTFYANRPFVYLIQEWDTQVIFFIGTYQGN